ncbi:STAS domain-containing protein [Rheinheimera marina]|uniref:STAS domain-containing protein n=1 Tax=Rheinheimera marina TaxID=1774958 RepID=A0ABV9JGD0_9GAMM
MTVQITPKADFLVVEFDQDFSIFSVRDYYSSLLKLADLPQENIILDLCAVQDFDSSGLQLLLWLRQHWPEKHFTLTHGDNPAVSRVLDLYKTEFQAA